MTPDEIRARIAAMVTASPNGYLAVDDVALEIWPDDPGRRGRAAHYVLSLEVQGKIVLAQDIRPDRRCRAVADPDRLHLLPAHYVPYRRSQTPSTEAFRDLIAAHGPMSVTQLAKVYSCSNGYARRLLEPLIEDGTLAASVPARQRRGRPATYYHLT